MTTYGRQPSAASIRTCLLASILLCVTTAKVAVGAEKCVPDAAIASAAMQSADLDARFGSVPSPPQPVRVAYVTQLLEDPFWSEVLKGLHAEADRLNVTFDASAPKDRASESEQLAVAKAALARNPDVLILTAINSTNLRSVIVEANSRGIPTISINLRSEGVRVHVGTNHVALGASGAEFLHEHFPAGAAIAQIEGEITSPYRIDRVKGFVDRLKDYPDLKLIASGQADWDDKKARNLTLRMMAAHPEIEGIYANSDLMAMGVVQALEEIGRLNDVVVVGTDGVDAAKKSISAGRLTGTAAQFPVKEGILGMQIGLRLLGCQNIPGWVISPQAVMTEKSVGDFDVTH